MKNELSSHDWQLLSAYLDSQLDARQTAHLETRLNTDTTLRQGLQSLEQTRLVLRAAPRRKAPRDFRLDPSMASSRSLPVLFPVFSFASAVAAVLFVILLLTDSDLGLRQQQNEAAEPMPAAAVMEMELAVEEGEATIEGTELPPVINWAAPPSGPAMGLGGSGGGDGSDPSELMDDGAPPAPQLLLEEVQEESMEEPAEDTSADTSAEPVAESIAESSAAPAPQEKEAGAQEAPPAGEAIAEPTATQAETTDTLREAPDAGQSEQVDQYESEQPVADSAGDEEIPGGPILGIQPSKTPAQTILPPVEAVESVEPESDQRISTRSLLQWTFAAASLLFGLLAVTIWIKSR